jgi:hypothetical protein
MVHEAMVLEYSARHLALIELAASLKLPALCLADRLRVRALGPRPAGAGIGIGAYAAGLGLYLSSLRPAASCWRCSRHPLPRCACSGCPQFLGAALMLGLLATLLRFVSGRPMNSFDFDVAHLLAGSLVLVSFMMLYQDRLYALLNIFALHACVLALSVAWQAYIQHAPHLYCDGHDRARVQGDRHPGGAAPRDRTARHPSRDRDVVGVGITMLGGIGLVALSIMIMLRVTPGADPLAREDLAFALAVCCSACC